MDCFAFVSLVNYCKVLISEVGVFCLWAELIGPLIGVMSGDETLTKILRYAPINSKAELIVLEKIKLNNTISRKEGRVDFMSF